MTIQGKVICTTFVWLTLLAAFFALLVSFGKAKRRKVVLRVAACILAAVLLVYLMPYLNGRNICVDLQLCHILSDTTGEKIANWTRWNGMLFMKNMGCLV